MDHPDCRSSEISLFARLTPCALRIPVPGLMVSSVFWRYVTGCQPEARARPKLGWTRSFVDGFCRNAIDSGAERFVWRKRFVEFSG